MDNTVDGEDNSQSLMIFEENGQDDTVNHEDSQINIDVCDVSDRPGDVYDQPLIDETQYPCQQSDRCLTTSKYQSFNHQNKLNDNFSCFSR